jgi:hypothetical protein
MPANTEPVYPLTPTNSCTALLDTADTDKDGSTAAADSDALAWTAGANGGVASIVRWNPRGSTSLGVGRWWIVDSGGTVIDGPYEIALPAVTASETAAQSQYEVRINYALEASWKIYAAVSTNQPASSGWVCAVRGFDY